MIITAWHSMRDGKSLRNFSYWCFSKCGIVKILPLRFEPWICVIVLGNKFHIFTSALTLANSFVKSLRLCAIPALLPSDKRHLENLSLLDVISFKFDLCHILYCILKLRLLISLLLYY